MNEKLDQIEKNQMWQFIPRSINKNGIGTKWVFRNILNENGCILRNSAKMVYRGYDQVEGIDYEDNFALVARL